MKKMKDILCSENGMKIVNALFLLSMIFNKSGFVNCKFKLDTPR